MPDSSVPRLTIAASEGLTVDLALVLAVDCSSSVDVADFRMQMDGIAAALRNPKLRDAIAAGPNRRIALSLVQWSTRQSQAVAIPWRLLAGNEDLEGAARETEGLERHWQPGGTGLAAAIQFSVALVETFQVRAQRRVIDVSGDGEDNEGGNTPLARDVAVARGITINGLPIINGSRQLETYYRTRVTGGPGSFVLPATDMRSFRAAMSQKLLREVGEMIS